MRIKGADRDLVAEYVAAVLAGGIRSNTAVAAELGVPRTSLDAALRMARADGDARLAEVPKPERRRFVEDLDVGQTRSVSALDADEVRRARITVACRATGADDLRDLLEELGLLGLDGAA